MKLMWKFDLTPSILQTHERRYRWQLWGLKFGQVFIGIMTRSIKIVPVQLMYTVCTECGFRSTFEGFNNMIRLCPRCGKECRYDDYISVQIKRHYENKD